MSLANYFSRTQWYLIASWAALVLSLCGCDFGTQALASGTEDDEFVVAEPEGFSATVASTTSILLQWQDERSKNHSGYEIEVSGGMNTILQVMDPNATSFMHSGLIPDTFYSYKIRAYSISEFRSNEESEWTDAQSATTDEVVINLPPSVNAGADQNLTLPTNSAMLSGSASDSDGIKQRTWTNMGGPSSGTINTPNESATLVSGLVQGSYTFRLTATDNLDASASDDVIVNVGALPNVAPTASAGEYQPITLPTNFISLVGSGHDSDGEIKSYAWTKEQGPSATLTGENTATLALSKLVQGTYKFRLTVTDDAGAKGSDDTTVIVNPAPNQAPLADAGANRPATVGSIINFDGSDSSDPDGSIVSYSWTFGDGVSASGVNVNHAFASANTFTVTLTVTDNRGATDSDSATITVEPAGPSPSGEFACLSQAGRTLIKTYPAQTYTTQQRTTTSVANANIDARLATFISYANNKDDKNSYPYRTLGNGACSAGGVVKGEYSFSVPWRWFYHLCPWCPDGSNPDPNDSNANNAGYLFEGDSKKVSGRYVALYSNGILDGARIHNVWDGIRPQKHDHWQVRNVWITHNRDDCVENDYFFNGMIYDSLFDGCFSGVSGRDDDRMADGYYGLDKVVRLEKVLMRIESFPGTADDPNPAHLGHGGFFKWDSSSSSKGPSLALVDNVFMVEDVGSDGNLNIPKRADGSFAVTECRNNVIVWLGAGLYPGDYPSECFTVSTDRRDWEGAMEDWKARHPLMKRIDGVDL